MTQMIFEHYGQLFSEEVKREEKIMLWHQIMGEYRRLGHGWTKV
jgi:hypothetical protein